MVGRSTQDTREGALLLSSLITLLTTFPLYLVPAPARAPAVKPFVEEQMPGQGEPVSPPGKVQLLSEQIRSLTAQIQEEKYRVSQLTLLNELSQQLEAELDPPVSAQLAVNTLERAVDCSLVALFMHEPDNHEYIVLASAGSTTSLIPPGYRQDSTIGLLGRTTRLKKTNMVHDIQLDNDVNRLENDTTRSIINVPILQHGHVKAVLE